MKKQTVKKKPGFFGEKLSVTVSSRECTHRAPVCFTVHRGFVFTLAVLLTAVVAFCTYTAVNALLTVQALAGTTDALNTRIEQQSGQISQYEQEIGELEQDQP